MAIPEHCTLATTTAKNMYYAYFWFHVKHLRMTHPNSLRKWLNLFFDGFQRSRKTNNRNDWKRWLFTIYFGAIRSLSMCLCRENIHIIIDVVKRELCCGGWVNGAHHSMCGEWEIEKRIIETFNENSLYPKFMHLFNGIICVGQPYVQCVISHTHSHINITLTHMHKRNPIIHWWIK